MAEDLATALANGWREVSRTLIRSEKVPGGIRNHWRVHLVKDGNAESVIDSNWRHINAADIPTSVWDDLVQKASSKHMLKEFASQNVPFTTKSEALFQEEVRKQLIDTWEWRAQFSLFTLPEYLEYASRFSANNVLKALRYDPPQPVHDSDLRLWDWQQRAFEERYKSLCKGKKLLETLTWHWIPDFGLTSYKKLPSKMGCYFWAVCCASPKAFLDKEIVYKGEIKTIVRPSFPVNEWQYYTSRDGPSALKRLQYYSLTNRLLYGGKADGSTSSLRKRIRDGYCRYIFSNRQDLGRRATKALDKKLEKNSAVRQLREYYWRFDRKMAFSFELFYTVIPYHGLTRRIINILNKKAAEEVYTKSARDYEDDLLDTLNPRFNSNSGIAGETYVPRLANDLWLHDLTESARKKRESGDK